jgi:hypothetical protein
VPWTTVKYPDITVTRAEYDLNVCPVQENARIMNRFRTFTSICVRNKYFWGGIQEEEEEEEACVLSRMQDLRNDGS